MIFNTAPQRHRGHRGIFLWNFNSEIVKSAFICVHPRFNSSPQSEETGFQGKALEPVHKVYASQRRSVAEGLE